MKRKVKRNLDPNFISLTILYVWSILLDTVHTQKEKRFVKKYKRDQTKYRNLSKIYRMQIQNNLRLSLYTISFYVVLVVRIMNDRLYFSFFLILFLTFYFHSNLFSILELRLEFSLTWCHTSVTVTQSCVMRKDGRRF